MSHYNQQSTSNSNRVGAPIIPPSNELMSTPMTETVVIAREEYETLLSTVRQLTNTVEGLSRQVARLEQDTAAHERSLALYDYEEGGSLESQPVFQSVRTGGPRTGSRGEAASSSTVGDEEEDSAENRRLFRVKLYVEKKQVNKFLNNILMILGFAYLLLRNFVAKV
jgi:hypothetical protein